MPVFQWTYFIVKPSRNNWASPFISGFSPDSFAILELSYYPVLLPSSFWPLSLPPDVSPSRLKLPRVLPSTVITRFSGTITQPIPFPPSHPPRCLDLSGDTLIMESGKGLPRSFSYLRDMPRSQTPVEPPLAAHLRQWQCCLPLPYRRRLPR